MRRTVMFAAVLMSTIFMSATLKAAEGLGGVSFAGFRGVMVAPAGAPVPFETVAYKGTGNRLNCAKSQTSCVDTFGCAWLAGDSTNKGKCVTRGFSAAEMAKYFGGYKKSDCPVTQYCWMGACTVYRWCVKTQ